MTREIRDIPPAPRRVRWRAVLWHWWPLAFSGFVLGVYGGLITLMLVLAHGGKPADDLLLDHSHPLRVEGRVTEVTGGDGDRPAWIAYRFDTRAGSSKAGRSFAGQTGLKTGDEVEIEYVRDHPHINRIVGGRISLGPALYRAFFWFFFAGILCIAIWMLAVLRLRRVMQNGDVAMGTIRSTRPIRFVNPSMLRVDYTFRDHHATEREAWHWVRARSALGERLAKEPTRIAVVHRRANRCASRLVMADDFLTDSDRVVTEIHG